jgi:multidrug resistance protein, MATE family
MMKHDGKLLDEAKTHVSLGWKVAAAMLMKRSVDVVSFMYIGRLGEDYMSSSSLASVTSNVVGNSILVGLVGALSTLASQASGSGNYTALNDILLRAVCIMTCICVPISVLWIYSYDILTHLGQSDHISSLAVDYLVYLIPALFAVAYSLCIQEWLYAQQKANAPASIAVAVAFIHPLFCQIFVYYFDFKYLGSAMALSTTRILELLLLLGYLHISGSLVETNFQFSIRCFQKWGEFFKLGLPNILMMSEWWADEAIVFLSGTFSNPAVEISAMAVYQYIIVVCYMVPKGFQTIACARVGNFVGDGDGLAAHRAAYVSPLLATIVAILFAIPLIVFRTQVGYIFTTDEAVVKLTAVICTIIPFYIVADSVQCSLSGVLTGVGKQHVAGPLVMVCYYVIGLPLAVYFAYDYWHGFGWGVYGLCFGVTIAKYFHMIFYYYICYHLNWDEEVKLAADRLKKITLSLEDFEIEKRSELGSSAGGERRGEESSMLLGEEFGYTSGEDYSRVGDVEMTYDKW